MNATRSNISTNESQRISVIIECFQYFNENEQVINTETVSMSKTFWLNLRLHEAKVLKIDTKFVINNEKNFQRKDT